MRVSVCCWWKPALRPPDGESNLRRLLGASDLPSRQNLNFNLHVATTEVRHSSELRDGDCALKRPRSGLGLTQSLHWQCQ